METTIVYWGYVEIMKKMETNIDALLSSHFLNAMMCDQEDRSY